MAGQTIGQLPDELTAAEAQAAGEENVLFGVDVVGHGVSYQMKLAEVIKSQDSRVVDTVADLATATPRDGQLWQTRGYTTVGDGGANLYRYDVAATDAVDGGWVINGPSSVGRYLAIDRSVANVRQFGAKGDGTTDDTAAIQAAINASTAARFVISAAGGSSINRHVAPRITLPHGRYVTSSPLIFDNDVDPVNFIGDQSALIPDAGFTGSYAIEIGGTTTGVGNVNIEGLHLIDYPNGIRCGESPNNYSVGQIRIRYVRFIGTGTGTGLYLYNRSSNAVIRECQFDNWRHTIRAESCDIVHVDDCRFVQEQFEDTSTRPAYTGTIILNTGQLHVTGSVFIATGTYNGTQPVGWFYVDDPASTTGTHSVHCTLILERNHFGAENSGLTPVLWDAAPYDANPFYVRRLIIRDNYIGCNREIGPGPIIPVVGLVQIPNAMTVECNEYGRTRIVAASYIDGAVAPTPWLPTANKPLMASSRNNVGGSTLAWGRTNDWIPDDIGTSTLAASDTTPAVNHANETTVLKFANGSATSVTNFDTEASGKRIIVFVDDNTTLVNSAGLRLAGATNFSPGANGAMMMFINMEGAWYEVSRTAF